LAENDGVSFFIFSAKLTPKSQLLLRRFDFFHLILKNSAQKKGCFFLSSEFFGIFRNFGNYCGDNVEYDVLYDAT